MVGDILHDEVLGDIGILLERADGSESFTTAGGGHVEAVPVWRTWWITAGEQYYSEFGLKNLVHLSVFVRHPANEVPELKAFDK
jgi:hypothetical protein